MIELDYGRCMCDMKNKKRNRNGGFTLVELLATLAILSIVVSIGVSVVTGVINKTKENAYETTINNVEAMAKNFIIENSEDFSWFNGTDCKGSGTCEYQCVTVKNLINSGYFTGDILESEIAKETNLDIGNVVYIERDKVNKTITHQILDNNDTSCKGSNEIGRIIFDKYNNSWEQKKTVRITYILYDLDTSDYTYEYSYTGNGDKGISSTNFSDSNKIEQNTEEFTGNGTLTATIRKKSDPSIWLEKKLTFNKIDNVKPGVTNFVSLNEFRADQKFTMTISDNESGVVGYYFGRIDVEDGDTLTDSDFKYFSVSGENEYTIDDLIVNDSGYWYAHAIDAAGNYSPQSGIFLNRIKFVIGNSADVPSDLTLEPSQVRLQPIPGKYMDLSNVRPSLDGYSIVGWYTKSSLDESSKISDITKVIINHNTLYAKVVENKIEDATVSIVKTATATGNRFNAVVSNIKLNYGNVGSNVSYKYQWYKNGEVIPGATRSYLNSDSSYKGQKIHVEVTVSKPYYVANKFASSVLEIPKDAGYVQLNRTTSSIVKGKTSSITFQITDHHGGSLSVRCSTKLTCYITGKVVTVTGLNALSVGQTTIDVFSSETATNAQAKATYTLRVTSNSFVEEIK